MIPGWKANKKQAGEIPLPAHEVTDVLHGVLLSVRLEAPAKS